MFRMNKKRLAAVVAIAFMSVGTGASVASAHADGSKGGRTGTRVPLTATQEACLTAQGHIHPSKSATHVKDAAHKAANNAAYTACGITRGAKTTTTAAG
jgi:hypothetical protein